MIWTTTLIQPSKRFIASATVYMGKESALRLAALAPLAVPEVLGKNSWEYGPETNLRSIGRKPTNDTLKLRIYVRFVLHRNLPCINPAHLQVPRYTLLVLFAEQGTQCTP